MKKLALSLAALLLSFSLPARAEFPKNWYLEGVGDFLEGDILSTAIEADGSLSLGLDIAPMLKLNTGGSILDAESLGSQIFLGTGNPAGVYQVDGNQGKYTLKTLLERSQGVVSAVLPQKNGDVLAALSPFGQIYRIHQGKAELILSLDERYIWEMQAGPNGEVYILTGDKAVLYRLDRDLKLTRLYQSNEANLKVLHQDRHWGLLVGSGSKGIVYRIQANQHPEALMDSDFTEVTAMTGDGKGNVFVAATRENPPKNQPKSAVFMISPSGQSEMLFRMNTETAFTLELDQAGSLLIGTGPRGRIYRFTDPLSAEKRMLSLPARGQSRQLAKIIPGQGSELFMVGSSPAQIERFQGNFLSKGEYETQIFKSSLKANWGNLRFDALMPADTAVRAWSRSGNTAEPDNTWSAWEGPYSDPKGSPIKSPPGSYLQLRFELSSKNPKHSPKLHSIDISFMRENLAPYFNDVYFLQRGLFFKPHTLGKIEGPRILDLNAQVMDKLRRPKGTDEIYQELIAEKMPLAMRVIQDYRPGMLTLAWDASDPNDDNLEYEVSYQRFGDQTWKSLAHAIQDSFYSFDSATLAEGQYHFRVTANDALSNPGQGFRIAKETQLITIDNTPPAVSALSFNQEEKTVKFSFSAKDTVTPLAYAEYSLDGQKTELFQSKDGIIDGLDEQFEILLKKPAKGSHTLVVRVLDRLGNVQTAQKVFEIR